MSFEGKKGFNKEKITNMLLFVVAVEKRMLIFTVR